MSDKSMMLSDSDMMHEAPSKKQQRPKQQQQQHRGGTRQQTGHSRNTQRFKALCTKVIFWAIVAMAVLYLADKGGADSWIANVTHGIEAWWKSDLETYTPTWRAWWTGALQTFFPIAFGVSALAALFATKMWNFWE